MIDPWTNSNIQIGMMIDDAPADLWGRDIRVACSVCAVQGDAMVIRLAFTGAGAAFRAYHLVYHSADASFLFMLPFHASEFRPTGAGCPLPLRREDGGCTLLLLANRHNPATDRYAQPGSLHVVTAGSG
jgi:hypothetical protein